MNAEVPRTEHAYNPPPKATVVICCHKLERVPDIRQAAGSALDQTYSPCEVIVSVDHNQELFETLKRRLPAPATVTLSTATPGLSGARNHAIRAATGDLIAFMDDDGVASEDWLEQLVCHYSNSSMLAVGGRIIPLWESTRPCWFPQELDWTIGGSHKGMADASGPVRNLWGGNMSFRREVFQQVGLFDTRLGRIGSSGEGEDTEFCLRIANRIPEVTIMYEPNAIMYHKVPRQRARLKYVLRRAFDGGLSLGRIKGRQTPQSDVPLSTEGAYLRYLLTSALPERIRHSYRPQAIAQIGVILLAVAATGCGYSLGMATSRRHGKG